MILSGRCFCGSVRWRSSGPVLWAGHCHCESCRSATSSPFTSFFGVPLTSVTWSGELSAHLTSRDQVRRQHCPHCGTQMSYQRGDLPDEVHLYAASLDEPQLFEPEAHFYYAEKVPWITLDDDLPRYPGSAENAGPL